MRFGVVVFPGTWSDCDFHYVVAEVLHQPVRYVWHRDTELGEFDCLILPGGFSYGDYLRAGAVAGRSPVVEALPEFVARGGLVLGSCNGFQILCEAGLLPGALMRNECLQYRCQSTHLRRGERRDAVHARPAAGPGAQDADLPRRRASTTPTRTPCGGSASRTRSSSATATEDGRVDQGRQSERLAGQHRRRRQRRGHGAGLMPHPERAAETAMGGTDGLLIFHSLLGSLVEDGTFLRR